MTDRSDAKARGARLWDVLEAAGLLTYGADISGEAVRGALGIEMPEFGRREDFARIELLELSAVDHVRQRLIENGMYIARSPDGYRVLLPSENLRQVDAYMRSASRKVTRARKLQEMTPAASDRPDGRAARIFMREQSAKGFSPV